MKIKPLKDNILLEVLKQETESAIVLVDKFDDETAIIGKILEVGEATTLKVGDKVLFKKHLFDEILFKNMKEPYLLGKEEAVTAVIHD